MSERISAAENVAEFLSGGWVTTLSALLVPLIAVLGVWIAYQQWNTNQANLREKLFERRFAVFKQTQKFLSEISRARRLEDSALADFHDTPQVARFLFGPEISSYLEEIRQQAFKQRRHERRAQNAKDEAQRVTALRQEDEALDWLSDQLPAMFDKFEPWLGFRDHK